mgnify:CR=1 FL=1
MEQEKMDQTERPDSGSGSGCEPCPLCGGRGFTLWRKADGELYSRDCPCEMRRINRLRLAKSGLSDLVERYTFQRYRTPEDWQRTAKEAAQRYLKDWQGKWFFIGGTSGAGKTHLCTAICGQLIESGVPVRYMQWRNDIPPIKAAVNDEERYRKLLAPLKQVKALYIDDFLKGSQTEGDLNIAFELLNHRYIDNGKITILSSEMTLDRIVQWDVGIGGRISERAKGFVFNLSGKENWRLA